jgi:hypothetical protein
MTLDSGERFDRLVIYPSRSKLVLVLLGSIAFVLLGIWIGSPGVAQRVPRWKIVFVSYVGAPFFTACGLYAAYRLVSHRPSVEIDSKGVSDSASGLAAGRLSWDEVDHLVLYRYSGQPLLGIVPRDLEIFLSRQHPVRRSLTKLNLALGCAPVNIPQVALPMKVVELAELLHTRYGVRVEGDA